MARIPDGQLERVKRELSLVRLIEGQGIALISLRKMRVTKTRERLYCWKPP